jgi:hypothetical protein
MGLLRKCSQNSFNLYSHAGLGLRKITPNSVSFLKTFPPIAEIVLKQNKLKKKGRGRKKKLIGNKLSIYENQQWEI